MARVAVIGGGFSGLMTAYHILTLSEIPVAVDLFNHKRKTSQGVAYSSDHDFHLLNVTADKMSALPEAPDDYSRWLSTKGNCSDHSRLYTSRKQYGQYLSEKLHKLRSEFPSFTENNNAVTDITSTPAGYVINNKAGNTYSSVVLATGNLQPLALTDSHTEHQIRDPWDFAEIGRKAKEYEKVFILGTGLSTMDVLLFLKNENFQREIIAVSTNGFIPHTNTFSSPYPSYLEELNECRDLNEIYRVVKKHLKQAASKQLEAQAVIDVLRPYVQPIWTRLTETDQQRFLRHLKHGWNILRHRIPTETSECVQSLIKKGQLKVMAGKIAEMNNNGKGMEIKIKLKKSGTETFSDCLLINCTGPLMNYGKAEDDLYRNLFRNGLAAPGPHGIGLNATIEGEILDVNNKPVENIYTLGPALRSVLWETTAVNEIRNQAKKIAKKICIAEGLIS